jgi:hypothetical protein
VYTMVAAGGVMPCRIWKTAEMAMTMMGKKVCIKST